MTIKMKKSSSFIPTFHKLKTKGSSGSSKIYTYVPPPPWTPEKIDGLLFWYDPADTYTDGENVGTWTKRAGSQGTTLTSSGTARPTRSELNGARILSFDRSLSQVLSCAVGTTWTLGVVICVAQYVSSGGGTFTGYNGLFTSNQGDSGLVVWIGTPGYDTFYDFGMATLYTDGAETMSAGIDSPHVYRAVGRYDVVTDGYGMAVGRDRIYTYAERYWNGLIGDIVGLPRDASAEDIAATENYLRAKYGLSLP